MKKLKLEMNENELLALNRILVKVEKGWKLKKTDQADAEHLIYVIKKLAEKKDILLLLRE